MKHLSFVLVLTSFLSLSAAAAESWNGRIYRAEGVTQISKEALIQELSGANHIIMGEKHYTPAVQQTQADIINGVVQLTKHENNFTTAWEFLNATQKDFVQLLFSEFVQGKITSHDFLDATQGKDEENYSYAPVLEATKALGGSLLATNLTRAEKAPVVKGGMKAADPALVPPGFEMGSQGYHDRFAEFMKMAGHATPEMIENYYAAQCLTDDVIAYHLTQDTPHDLKFLVVGSFHTDFFDGTLARVKIRAPQLKTISVSIVDASDYEEADLLGAIHDDRYGNLADYVIFVNEPSPPQAFGWFNLNAVKNFVDQLR